MIATLAVAGASVKRPHLGAHSRQETCAFSTCSRQRSLNWATDQRIVLPWFGCDDRPHQFVKCRAAGKFAGQNSSGADRHLMPNLGCGLMRNDALDTHPRWPNCETWWCGRKAWSGARRSAAARWPAS